VKILKGSCPQAFTAGRPAACKPQAAFIDGQIKLMAPSWIKTWEEFVRQQFVKPIQDCFDHHADVVVLAFDNYAHVPLAKAPTQRKRSEKVSEFHFEAAAALPPVLPENWQQAMRNRVFKNKVVHRVLQMVRAEFTARLQQTTRRRSLVLDWHGQPEVLGHALPLPEMEALRRGECDIKAFSYLHLGTLLVLSTDGDFLPLALLQLEAARREDARCNILLNRMAVRVAGGAKKGAGCPQSKYEYVNVALLADFVRRSVKGPEPIRLFAAFVAMTGCDFAQNLPRLGPKKIWQDRALFPAYETVTAALILLFATKLYDALFRKHVATCLRGVSGDATEEEVGARLYATLLGRVQKAPTVAPTIKDSLWAPARLCAHSRNAEWTLHYWTLLDQHPDFLGYGWQVDSGGRVAFQGVQ